MGVYIKGAKKPDHCLLCFAFRGDMCAVAKREVILSKGVQEWCPLVEIPPHGRLIDADELEGEFEYCSEEDRLGRLLDVPTVIESEVEE